MAVIIQHGPIWMLLAAVMVSSVFRVLAYPFTDVSIQAGMDYSGGPRRKYGGPCVADLNGDGFPDLLLGHHDDKYTQVFLNNGKGKFVRLPWNHWDDTHGLSPFRAMASQKSMYFILMRGGSNGLKPTSALIFMLNKGNKVQLTSLATFATGRGRTTVFLPLNPRFPGINNVLLFNAKPVINNGQYIFAGTVLPNGSMRKIGFSGLAQETNWFATVTDVDRDGRMELITYEQLRIYKNTSPYRLTDVSARVLPKAIMPIRSVVAVAELDFDNDGLMDLYVARTSTGDLKWVRSLLSKGPSDYLLRNVGGRYVDVTKSARIPAVGESRGVTVGDFNNDGWIDIFVTQYQQPHRMLWNNGDGTFRLSTPGLGRRTAAYGDQPAAVDYDRDGRLDLILSEGDYISRANGGQFRIMKNIASLPNYLLVRVGSSPRRTAISLHAVATVRAGNRSMIRRVGSSGTAVSVSYIELLHFGLGSFRSASVTVRWADGSTQFKQNVQANTLLTFGIV